MVRYKLIAARKKNHLSQRKIAEMLSMTQSQYQRKESGAIHVSDEEWRRISIILKEEIQNIKEDDDITAIFNYDNHSVNFLSNNNYFFNILEFLIKKQLYDNEIFKREIKDEIKSIKKLLERNLFIQNDPEIF